MEPHHLCSYPLNLPENILEKHEFHDPKGVRVIVASIFLCLLMEAISFKRCIRNRKSGILSGSHLFNYLLTSGQIDACDYSTLSVILNHLYNMYQLS